MSLLQEALREQPISRRDFGRVIGTGALGFTGIVFLGCGENTTPRQTNQAISESVKPSIRSAPEILKSPPEGFKYFRSTQFPYEVLVPSDWKYIPLRLDLFEDPKDPETTLSIYPQATGNWVNLEAYESAVLNDFTKEGYKITKVSPGVKSSDPLYSKLSEIAATNMDNRLPRVIHISPPASFAGLEGNKVITFVFNKEASKAWHINTGYQFKRATAAEQTLSLYSKLGVAMKSFHSLA